MDADPDLILPHGKKSPFWMGGFARKRTESEMKDSEAGSSAAPSPDVGLPDEIESPDVGAGPSPSKADRGKSSKGQTPKKSRPT